MGRNGKFDVDTAKWGRKPMSQIMTGYTSIKEHLICSGRILRWI